MIKFVIKDRIITKNKEVNPAQNNILPIFCFFKIKHIKNEPANAVIIQMIEIICKIKLNNSIFFL